MISQREFELLRSLDRFTIFMRLEKNSLVRAFRANSHLVAPDEIEGKIKHAEFVEKEILALYSLKISSNEKSVW